MHFPPHIKIKLWSTWGWNCLQVVESMLKFPLITYERSYCQRIECRIRSGSTILWYGTITHSSTCEQILGLWWSLEDIHLWFIRSVVKSPFPGIQYEFAKCVLSQWHYHIINQIRTKKYKLGEDTWRARFLSLYHGKICTTFILRVPLAYYVLNSWEIYSKSCL